MKTIASAACVLLLLGAGASAQTLDDLKNDGKGGTTDNVLTYGMGYHQHRYSPLKQIDKQTVKRLVPVWNLSLDNNCGEQAQPIVYNGVMYVTNAQGHGRDRRRHRQADLEQPVDSPPETPRVVCCGVSNKGAAIYNGKVFRATLDAHVVALDAKTGKEMWKTKVAEWKEGYSMTLAPLIANGVLITGMSGAEFGVRGFLDGWDPETGKQLWRRYTIPAPRRKGQRDLAAGQRSWKTGRRLDLDHRLLRSRARPGVSGASAMPAPWARGPRRATTSTPRRCSRCGRRPARSSGTTSSRRTKCSTSTRVGDDPRRHRRRRREAQGDDADQPQRLPLRDRPHQRRSCSRPSRSRRSTGRPTST